MNASKILIILGGLNAFLAVALGAFGAHALKSRLSPELLNTWETAVQYHIIHALGIILVAIIIRLITLSAFTLWSAIFMGVGIILFSGSLYLLCLTGFRALGMITPLGGISFLIGWLLLCIGAFKYL